ALARCTKSDSTHSCDHVFRVPGTLNWPSQRKIAKGRSPVPWQSRLTFFLEDCTHLDITPDDLRTAIVTKYPDAFGGANSSSAKDRREFNWNQRRGNLRPITSGKIDRRLDLATGQDRSALAFSAICYLRGFGYSPGEIYLELEQRAKLPAMGHYVD